VSVERLDLAWQFRIPHSEFRIKVAIE